MKKIFELDDQGSILVEKKKNKVKVKAYKGYSQGIDLLCKMVDNENGYTVKFPSYSSLEPDRYLSLDYSQAVELYYALKVMLKNQ